MIAVSEFVVGLVSSLIAGGLLALLVYLFARLTKSTRRTVQGFGAARWLMVAGALIAVVGVIDLVWTQASVGPFGHSAAERWETAAAPIFVIAAGLLVNISAQILQTLQQRHPSPSN